MAACREPHAEHAGQPRVADLLAHKRPLLIFAGCLLLFHLANAAMLPLMGSVLTMRSSQWATVLIAACIVVPQMRRRVVSPWVGTQAQQWGRRPLLLIGFAALPMRGLLFAHRDRSRMLLVAVQLLDGVTAAVFGVMVPLDHRRSDARHRTFQSRPRASSAP